MLKKIGLFFLLCMVALPLKADTPYIGAAWHSVNSAFDYANGHWPERLSAVGGCLLGCLVLSCCTPNDTSQQKSGGYSVLASPLRCCGTGVVAVTSFLLMHGLLKHSIPAVRLIVPAIISFGGCVFKVPNPKYTFRLYGAALAGAALGVATCYGIRSVW